MGIMSKEKNFERVDTSGVVNKTEKQPSVPVHIPMAIVRWMAYSLCFGLILAPGFWLINARGVIGAAFILGHFASQLNALINKKL